MRGENTIKERYEKLKLKESLNRSYLYPIACKEIAFILRNAYQKTPKSLQALIFQDILTAFSLLPQIQRQSDVAAANMLLQSAEASLPKQKRVLAVTEFKHAMVAHKRRSKIQKDEQGDFQLPQDVLVHIFSFLDLHSLLSAAAVSWSWNAAANDDHLWESMYADFFSDSTLSKFNRLHMGGVVENKDNTNSKENLATGLRTDWRLAFQRAYKGSAKKFKSYRGYCKHCSSIVWLNHAKCSFTSSGDNCHTHHIKTLSSQQIIDYLLNDSLSSYSSSDSDSDTDTDDDGSVLKLWAYPQLHFFG